MMGMDVLNEDEISLTYICRICMAILKEPVRLNCGHRYCESCVNKQNAATVQCHQCEETTPINEVSIDEGFKCSMERSEVTCRLCDWTGIWKNFQSHLHQNHSDILCARCDEIFDSATDLDQHKKSSCQNMIVCCELLLYGCNEKFLRKNFSQHCFTEKHQQLLTDIVNQSKLNISQKKASPDRSIKSQLLIKVRHLNEQISDLIRKYRTLNDHMKRMNDRTLVLKSSLSDASIFY